MPSDAFIGLLSGLAGAHKERQQNIFDMEVKRREQLANQWEKLAENPNIVPEAAEEYYKKAFGIRTADVGKKLPKEFESLDLTVAPKSGQSWLGGQTSRDVTPQPMPIPSNLEGGLTLQQIQQGAVPQLGERVEERRLPTAEAQRAPMPEPPPGLRRSPFLSAEEQFNQKLQQALTMLRGQEQIRTEESIKRAEAEARLRPERFVPFGAESGIIESDTGKVVREPQFRPTSQNLTNLQRDEVLMKGGSKPVSVLRDLDPASPTVGHVFLPTPQGLKDVTGETDVYERPFASSAGGAGEPLYPVVQNGAVVYVPRSQAAGQAAPRTLYDQTGAATTGGVPGLSTTRPPTVSDTTQSNIAGWRLAMDLLDKDVIPNINKLQSTFGPVIGRVANIQIRNLGGWGTSPEEQAIAVNLRRLLMSQAFAEGGKQLTPTEKEEFIALNPALEDTVGQALVKAKLSRDYLQRRLDARLATMSVSQRSQLQPSTPPSGTPKVGDVVNIGGKRIQIKSIYPDGTFDGDEVK